MWTQYYSFTVLFKTSQKSFKLYSKKLNVHSYCSNRMLQLQFCKFHNVKHREHSVNVTTSETESKFSLHTNFIFREQQLQYFYSYQWCFWNDFVKYYYIQKVCTVCTVIHYRYYWHLEWQIKTGFTYLWLLP